MFGRPGVTYESAQTRKYQLGRTEVIRSSSSEAKRWAKAMLNPNETVSSLARFAWTGFDSVKFIYLFRTLIARACSVRPLRGTYNMLLGRLMARVSIGTSLA